MSAVLEFLEDVWRFLEDIIDRFGDDPEKLRGHLAAFGDESDIISSDNTGFSVNGKKNLSNKLSHSNMLVVAPTGSGKSATVIFPTCYTVKGASLIINDTGECWEKLGGFFESEGYEVKVLDLNNCMVSCGYNPLNPDRIKNASGRYKVASMLVDSSLGTQSKDPYWSLSAGNLAGLTFNILATQAKEFQTLYNARMLLNAIAANPEGVKKLFADHASDEDYAEFESFMALDERQQGSIISTAKAALQLMTDDHIAKITSFDTLDLASFRTKPTVLFVRTSIGNARYHNPLVSLFFQQIITELLERFPKDNERDIYLLLEEAPTLRIPVLPLAMANCRKAKFGILLVCQSEQQLVTNFGHSDAESIMANAVTKLYMPGMPIETAQKLEHILGKTEIVVEDENDENKKRKETVSLMTADTIRSLPPNKAILLSGSNRAAIVKLYPYYKNPRFRRYSEMPPPKQTCQLPFFTIPTLPLKEPDDEA